jgi:hypothetical protein
VGVAATEIVLDDPSPQAMKELDRHFRSVVRTGSRVCLEVPQEADVAKVVEIALRSGAKIFSLNPVRISLEDYFLAHVGPPPGAPRDSEGISLVNEGGAR